MLALMQTLLYIITIAKFFVFAHFIMSWLVSFQVLNVRQPFVAQVWYGLNRLMEPVYGPIRRMLPSMGGIDLSPIVVLIGLFFLERLIGNSMYSFA